MAEPHLTYDQQQHTESHAPYMTVFYVLLNFTLMEYFYAKHHGSWWLPVYMLVTAVTLTVVTILGSRLAGLRVKGGWITLSLVPPLLLSFIPVPLLLGLMVLAIIKATLVGMYFMHLKFEGRWVFFMLIPAAFLATVFIVALYPDVGMQKPIDLDQLEQEEEVTSAGAIHPLLASSGSIS